MEQGNEEPPFSYYFKKIHLVMTELKTKYGLTEKSNESGQVHLIMAVWGRSYVDLFLDLSLPSQLSARNLPEASQKGNLLYKIFTTRNDV